MGCSGSVLQDDNVRIRHKKASLNMLFMVKASSDLVFEFIVILISWLKQSNIIIIKLQVEIL